MNQTKTERFKKKLLVVQMFGKQYGDYLKVEKILYAWRIQESANHTFTMGKFNMQKQNFFYHNNEQ